MAAAPDAASQCPILALMEVKWTWFLGSRLVHRACRRLSISLGSPACVLSRVRKPHLTSLHHHHNHGDYFLGYLPRSVRLNHRNLVWVDVRLAQQALEQLVLRWGMRVGDAVRVSTLVDLDSFDDCMNTVSLC